MLVQFRRVPEAWPSTVEGKRPPSPAGIKLLTSNHEAIDWNPRSPDERLSMLSQIQVELRDAERCDEVLKGVDSVGRGVASDFQFFGNAWDLAVDATGVEFTYSVMEGEPGGRVSLETYRTAVRAWSDFLADDSCPERLCQLPD
ncbi:MAG: hypothetical protein EOP82_16180 [Variovorax sp.]|nr:MAG: hypothetical protein EOP82_16180 [Variovorax sp.]